MFSQHSFQVSAAISRSLVATILAISAAAMLWLSLNRETQAAIPFGKIFVVNNAFDSDTGAADDAFPGDGVCETGGGNGFCTLRAALDEVIARNNGGDGISFNIPTTDPGYSNGVWTIKLSTELPDISVPVSISGPGATKLIVDAANGGANGVFNITTNGTVSFSGIKVANARRVVSVGTSGGGGIQNANGGTVNVTNCILEANRVTVISVGSNGFGGAIYNASTGTINITNSTLKSNISINAKASLSFGGGIYNRIGTIHISNSSFEHNQADLGGAIYNYAGGMVTIIGSTFYENVATVAGGGISSVGTVSVTNSTFYSNIASEVDNGIGGGIHNQGSLNLTNSTLAGNFSNLGGGGVAGFGAVSVKSCIIASNYGGRVTVNQEAPDVYGHFTSKGFNLIGKKDGSTGFGAATDIKGTIASPLDPKLDPKGLRSNGGPTQTVALLVGSPAIDKGSSVTIAGTTLTTDQRGTGHPRTFDNTSVANASGGDGTDIGAYERETQ